MLERLLNLVNSWIMAWLVYKNTKQKLDIEALEVREELRKKDDQIENTEHSSDDVYAEWLRNSDK